MAAIDPKKLAAELGAEFVYMNPTPQTARRYWVMDQIWVFGLARLWIFMAFGPLGWPRCRQSFWTECSRATLCPQKAIVKTSICTRKEGGSSCCIHRTQRLGSWCRTRPKWTQTSLSKNLASKLKLPDGFKFEIKTLTRDLSIDTRNANGLAHIIRDNLHDIYQGCGFDNACSYIP